MSKQEVILCKELENDLTHAIGKCPHDKLFILTDEHTHRLCLPQLQSIPALENAAEIIIGAEDVHKNLETLASVWQALSEQGATRHSLLINLGGGMVTDLGGFAAATFKRGIAYINIPTTLLAMVDASVGGKTGINFNIFIFSSASILRICFAESSSSKITIPISRSASSSLRIYSFISSSLPLPTYVTEFAWSNFYTSEEEIERGKAERA